MTDNKMYFYSDVLGSRFDSIMNMYDVNKRIHIIFDRLLQNDDLNGKLLLDAGCGTGWFSTKAAARSARVFSMDLGSSLLNEVRRKCASARLAGSVLSIPFASDTFDYVICTEVIEHTPDPRGAVSELMRVVRPGGIVIITVPNKNWIFSLWVANILKIRPYEGFENWVTMKQLVKYAVASPAEIVEKGGFHIIPFILRATYGFIDIIDRYGKALYPFMVNIYIKVKKLS
jgi:2-polyprenyl-3-methyl-5-hydroxy-6-metoxy-1,4-benzoquinol methylase